MRYIRRVNEHGLRRMLRGIFALQQALLTVCRSTARLDRATQCYELLRLQPEEVLQRIVADGKAFTEEQYIVVLNLIAASELVQDDARHERSLAELHDLFEALV